MAVARVRGDSCSCLQSASKQGPALLNDPLPCLLRNEFCQVGTGWSPPQGVWEQLRAKPDPHLSGLCRLLCPSALSSLPLALKPAGVCLSSLSRLTSLPLPSSSLFLPLLLSSEEATASSRQLTLLLASFQTFVFISPQWRPGGAVRRLWREGELRPALLDFL